jgi:hypothetical protein
VTEKVTPFAWVDSITQKTGDMMVEHGEKAYPDFMVSRALSYFPDTIMHAAEINQYQNLDYRLKYDYYLNSVTKRKRFSKWGKRKSDDDVKFIMEAWQYSRPKAEDAVKILTADQIKEIRATYTKGTEE